MNKDLDNLLCFTGNICIFGFFFAGIWFKDWSLWVLLIPAVLHFTTTKE
jgi:hypothetical protein